MHGQSTKVTPITTRLCFLFLYLSIHLTIPTTLNLTEVYLLLVWGVHCYSTAFPIYSAVCVCVWGGGVGGGGVGGGIRHWQ